MNFNLSQLLKGNSKQNSESYFNLYFDLHKKNGRRRVKNPIQIFFTVNIFYDYNSLQQCLKICDHNYVIIISRFEHFRVNISFYMWSPRIFMMQFNSMQLFEIPCRFERNMCGNIGYIKKLWLFDIQSHFTNFGFEIDILEIA